MNRLLFFNMRMHESAHFIDLWFLFSLYGKGFVFSENEHTALEQFEGGPCAVIAPVQV